MSNEDNEGPRTLDEIQVGVRSRSWPAPDQEGVDMSNVDNTDLNSVPSLAPPTLEQIRASRQPSPVPDHVDQPEVTLAEVWADRGLPPVPGSIPKLNPGEVEQIRAAAQAGKAFPNDVLALVNTINELSRRALQQFQKAAHARQDAAVARERADRAQAEMVELGRARSSDAREIQRLERHVKEVNQLVVDLASSAARERRLAVAGHDRAERAERRVAELEDRNQRLVDEMAQHNREKDSRIAELERQRDSARAERYHMGQLDILLGNIATLVYDQDVVAAMEGGIADLPGLVNVIKVIRGITTPYRPTTAQAEIGGDLLQAALDNWQAVWLDIHELVWGEGADRAMEDLPPYLGDESEQLSAEQVAGGHLAEVIKKIRTALPPDPGAEKS